MQHYVSQKKGLWVAAPRLSRRYLGSWCSGRATGHPAWPPHPGGCPRPPAPSPAGCRTARPAASAADSAPGCSVGQEEETSGTMGTQDPCHHGPITSVALKSPFAESDPNTTFLLVQVTTHQLHQRRLIPPAAQHPKNTSRPGEQRGGGLSTQHCTFSSSRLCSSWISRVALSTSWLRCSSFSSTRPRAESSSHSFSLTDRLSTSFSACRASTWALSSVLACQWGQESPVTHLSPCCKPNGYARGAEDMPSS